MRMLKKVGKRVLQIGLPLVILLVIVWYMKDDWQALATSRFQWNPWLMALAFLGFLLQELSYGLIWRTVLARLGVRLDLRACLRVYLASEFVRYIPGNVWHVLTRILWVGKYGVARSVAFASMAIELITKLAAGGLVFAGSLLFWSDVGALQSFWRGTPLEAGLGVVIVLGLLIGLHPRILNGSLNLALRVLKREPIVLTLRYRDILFVTFFWCISWIIAGWAFYVLLLALWPGTPLAALPICIGVYAIVWDLGFLSFITPGGLGVREVAIVALFAVAFPPSLFPAGLSSILAILSRIVSTLAELLCVSVAYLSGGKQIRAIRQDMLEEPSAHVEVEGSVRGE